MTRSEEPWWKDSVVYQIYPASFKDANGDGIGDLPGITQSLDYIKSLGVDVIWLCPMYDSPQVDMGYDVSDYTSIYPPYGTLADMENLIEQCHARGMRMILDLVINHTSNEHAWFRESSSSRDNAKSDWYIWRPAKLDRIGTRHPPNNWRATFGGSAWSWDERRQEYYLHLFCAAQPDLNWENEETRKAIYASAMTFWLEKGIDGFRVDTVNMYSKPTTFVDAPVTDPNAEWQQASAYYCNGPRMHEFLSEMNEILAPYGAMTVGELPHTPSREKVLRYVSAKEKQLSMVFQFDTVDVGIGSVFKYQTEPFAWSLPDLKVAVANTQSLIGTSDGWSTVFMENHDQARSISRFACDSPQWRVRSGKMLALLLATLSGTLFIYEGQEIGMINVPESWSIEEYKDVESSNYYKMVAERSGNDKDELAKAKRAVQHLSRDNARTPMQWTSGKNGGFSDAKPWMRPNDSYKDINVAQQLRDPTSVLAFWQRMLKVRKAHKNVLVHGAFEIRDFDDPHLFQFTKEWGGVSALVVCNFSSEAREWSMRECETGKSHLVQSNVDEPSDHLQPWEARLYML